MRQGIWWLIGFATLALIGVGYLFMQWQLSRNAEALVDRYAEMSEEEMLEDAAVRAQRLGLDIDFEAIQPPEPSPEAQWDMAQAQAEAQAEAPADPTPPAEFQAPVMTPAPSARRSGLDPSGAVQGAPVVEADIELRTGLQPNAVKPALTREQIAAARQRQADEAARIAAAQQYNDLLLLLGVLLLLAVFLGVGIYIYLVLGKQSGPQEPDAPAATRAPPPSVHAVSDQGATPDIAPPMHLEPPLAPPPNRALPPNLGREPTPASRSPRGPSPRPVRATNPIDAPQYRSPTGASPRRPSPRGPAPRHPAPTPLRPLPRLSSSPSPDLPHAGPQYYTPVGVTTTVTAPPPSRAAAADEPETPSIAAPGIYVPDPSRTPEISRVRVVQPTDPDADSGDVDTPISMFRTATPPIQKKPPRPRMPWLDDS